MANWYDASFRTTDNDVIEIIKNGETTDFYYDPKLQVGHCRLAWGLTSINVEKLEEIAEENKLSFYIRASDYLTKTVQEFEYKDGNMIVMESRYDPSAWKEINEDDL